MAESILTDGGSFGDYRVVRRLGKGGMGEVWLLASASGGHIAAKILDPAQGKDHESRRRFLREAELALDERHPNLIETYDVGEDPDTGLCYILMEYMPGGSLSDWIRRNGAMDIADAVSIVQSIAKVLEVGRQKGIVHRDIKPSNIMFAADGTPKLTDLGIARGKVSGTDSTTVTQTGVMIGTPAYMAPEQMLDAHSVDTRADIYSLGVVFYEMLTGERPNKDDTVVQLMAKALRGEAIPDVRTLRPEVSETLANFIAEMVAPNRENRVKTPRRVVHALEDMVRNGTLSVNIELIRRREEAAMETRRAKADRRQKAALCAALAVLGGVVVVGMAYLAMSWSSEMDNKRLVEENGERQIDGGVEKLSVEADKINGNRRKEKKPASDRRQEERPLITVTNKLVRPSPQPAPPQPAPPASTQTPVSVPPQKVSYLPHEPTDEDVEAMNLHSQCGWLAMSDAVRTLYPHFRFCERDAYELTLDVYRQNDRRLGYWRMYEGQRYAVKTYGHGNMFELDSPVKLTSGKAEVGLSIFAPPGARVYLRDADDNLLYDVCRIDGRKSAWHKVALRLLRHDEHSVRPMISVALPRNDDGRLKGKPDVFWSDLRMEERE